MFLLILSNTVAILAQTYTCVSQNKIRDVGADVGAHQGVFQS